MWAWRLEVQVPPTCTYLPQSLLVSGFLLQSLHEPVWSCHSLGSSSQPGAILPSRAHLAISETFLVVLARGGQRELPISGTQRPGKLLNILQCTGQTPNKELSTAQRLRNPDLSEPGSCRGNSPFPWQKHLLSLVIIFKIALVWYN